MKLCGLDNQIIEIEEQPIMVDNEKLFKSPRWNEYQPGKEKNITVNPTKEDEEKIKEFREFIDNKNNNIIQKEENIN